MSINRLSQYNFAISQSISGSFNTGDTVEASFLAKGNSSVANQYVTQFVDMKYSVSSESISLQEFPKGTFPEQFFIGQSYTTQSFTAGIPEEIQYVEFTLTGSLNGTGSNTYNSGGAANYQRELQLDYDAFQIKVHTPKTELTDSGLLVFTSPSKFIRANSDGIEIKGGNIEAEKITARELEVFGNTTIFGDITATANSPYNDTPQNISTTGDAGASALFARGDHQHNLPFATLDAVIQEGELTKVSGSATSTGSFGHLKLPEGGKIQFDSIDTFIRSNTANPEDLVVSADDDIILAPDNNIQIEQGATTYAEFLGDERELRITGNVSASGFISTNTNITASGNISSSGELRINQIYVGDGAEATPSIAFGLAGQEDTGLYRRADGAIGFSAGGDAMAVLGTTGLAIGGTYAGNNTQPPTNGLIVQGNVGIGTTDPTKPLQVEGEISSSGDLTISDGTRQLQYDVSAHALKSSGQTLDFNGTDFSFNTNDLFIDQSTSRVGIGTITASSTLTVEGDVSASGFLRFPEGKGIIFRNIKTGSGEFSKSSRENYLYWDLDGDNAWIYAMMPTQNKTNFIFELQDDGGSSESWLFWRNHYLGSGSDAFPLYMDSDKAVVNYFYDRSLTTHQDTPGNDNTSSAFDMGANNVDLYVMKSGSKVFTDPVLHADVSTARVGINKQNPAQALEVSGKILTDDSIMTPKVQAAGSDGLSLTDDSGISTNGIFIEEGGQVGIGTNTPETTLQVVGGIKSTNITASANISSSLTGSFGDGRFSNRVGIGKTAVNNFPLEIQSEDNILIWAKSTDNTAKIRLEDNGLVGYWNVRDMAGGLKSHFMSFGFGSTSTNSPFFIHSGSLDENHGKVSIGTQYTSSAILTVNGDISGSVTATGSFGRGLFDGRVAINDSNNQDPGWPELYVRGEGLFTSQLTSDHSLRVRNSGTDVINLDKTGHITASGNISASGTITAEALTITDDFDLTDDLTVNGDIRLGTNDSSRILFKDAAGDYTQNSGSILKASGNSLRFRNYGNFIFNQFKPDGQFTINGKTDTDIRFRLLHASNKVQIPTGSLQLQGGEGTGGHITASGNISSSARGLFNKVGIGTSPANNVELDVRGDALITGKRIYFAHDGGTDSNNDFMRFSDTSWQTAGGVLSLHTDQARSVGTGSVNMALFADGIYSSGNVGIGTSTPGEALEVVGNISASGDLILGGKINIDGDGGVPDATIEVSSDRLRLTDKSSVDVIVDSDGSNAPGDFRVRAHSGETTRFIVSSSGNVGIGTTTPIAELEIHSANSEAYHYPLVLRNPFNSETSLDYGVGIKFHLDDANDNKFGSIAYEAANAFANRGDLKFYVDQKDNTTPIATMTTTGLGIGTTSPDNALHISSSGNSVIKLESSGDSDFNGSRIYWSNGVVNSGSKAAYFWMNAGRGSAAQGGAPTFGIQRRGSGSVDNPGDESSYHGNILTYREGQHAQSGWLFATPTHTGSSETSNRFFISSSGNIGIGTINPTYTLDVNGNIGINQYIHHNGDDDTFFRFNGTDNIQLSAGGSHLNFTPTGLGVGVTATEKFDVDGNIKARGNISSPTFESGFAGSGFRITSGSDGKQSFTIDDLTVRGTMSVFELLIHQIRATNGSLFVSNTAKLSGSVETDNYSESHQEYELFFDTGSGYGHSFQVGDLIRAQRFVPSTNGSGSEVFKSDLHITSVDATGSAVGVLTGSGNALEVPQQGYEYVRIGSTSTTDRQGSIYLTADDGNAPFIDVIDNITEHSQFNTSGKVKTRIGKLDGITTSTRFGTLSGYGFYASGSAFLEGSINATSGSIGGFIIDNNEIKDAEITPDLQLKANGQITGSKVLFKGGTIGGWTINETTLTGGGATIDSTGVINLGSDITLDSNTNNGQIQVGTRVTLNGNTTSTIGGFTIDTNEFSSGDFKLNTDVETLQLGTVTDFAKDGSDKGLFVSGTGDFFIGKEDKDFIHFDASTGNLEISSSNIKVDVEDLQITASDIDMTTTQFEFDANNGDLQLSSTEHSMSLANGNIILDGTSTGFMSIGDVTSVTDTTGDNKGFYAEGDGDFITKAGVNKYIQFNAGELDIKTTKATISGSSVEIQSPNVFLGQGNSNFISASGGKLEISSSNFHLLEGNITASNVDLSGKITATSGEFTGTLSSSVGNIGGFTIDSSVIKSKNEKLKFDSVNQKIDVGTNVVIKGTTSDAFIGMGDKVTGFVDEGVGTEGILIGMDGDNPQAEFVKDANNHLIFDDGLTIKTTGTAVLSGSSVDIQTPKFFLGNQNKFISGSGTNIEISSSGFHLKRDGSAILSGSITAKQGTIGGFTISDNLSAGNDGAGGSAIDINPSTPSIKLGAKDSIVDDGGAGEDTGIFMNTSALVIGPQKYDASDSEFSGFRVLSSGIMTASKAKIMGDSDIAGFEVTDSHISASGLLLKSGGQITASAVNLSGKITATSGRIGGEGGWRIRPGEIASDDNLIRLLTISGSNPYGGAELSQSIVIGDTVGLITTLGQTLTKIVPNPTHGLRTTGKQGFSLVEFTNVTTPVKEYVRLDEEVRHISNWTINEENILSSGSNAKNTGIEIHSTQGIFGHGDSSTKETLTHAGMFKFTEDTLSSPGGGKGNNYDLTNDEIITFGGSAGFNEEQELAPGGTE